MDGKKLLQVAKKTPCLAQVEAEKAEVDKSRAEV